MASSIAAVELSRSSTTKSSPNGRVTTWTNGSPAGSTTTAATSRTTRTASQAPSVTGPSATRVGRAATTDRLARAIWTRDNRALNSLGDDIRPAYYVLESINRLHSYFMGMSQSFSTSSIGASLKKESWSTSFYQPKNNDKTISTMREILNAVTAVTAVVGVAVAFATAGAPPIVADSAAAMSTAVGVGMSAGSIQLQSE